MALHSLAREITSHIISLLKLQEGYLTEKVFNSAYELLYKQRKILIFFLELLLISD